METTDQTEEAAAMAAQAKLQQLRKTLLGSSACETGTTFSQSFAPTGSCRRCKGELPADRLFICAPCDSVTENEIATSLARKMAEAIEINMDRSGLPRAYRKRERGFDDVRNESAKALARAVVAGEVPGLYLHGAAGLDKTTLACATLAELIRNGMSGRYVNAAALLTDIQATYGEGATITRNDVVTPLIDAQALVIDDLGKEKASEHAAGVMYQILDARYAHRAIGNRRVLIICSNYAPTVAASRFREVEIAEPLMRRISEMTVAFEMKPEARRKV